MKAYVLDTNIILNDSGNIFKISQNGENKIILPETVIDEIDSKKSIKEEEIGYQAREFGRILSESKLVGIEKKEDYVLTKFLIEDKIELEIISLNEYKSDKKGFDRSSLNDRKIIEAALFIKTNIYNEKDNEIIFLSIDVMCYIRAISMGLKAESLTYKKKDKVYEFFKVLELETMPKEGDNILFIDKDYKIENYSYKFIVGNKEEYTLIVKGKIHLINVNDLNRSSIKPRNDEQVFALEGMLNKDLDIVLIDAIAGTGKTLIALSGAMRSVEKKQFDKIVYIRNSIESTDKGEDVGYLSGNEDKFMVYNFPLYDTLDFIVRRKKLKKKDTEKDIENKIEEMIGKYNIETMWVGSIRGRTITNAFVIIDEVQNFSRKSLKTVLSRLDDNSKAVCIGSNMQIDNPYVNKYTNGLSLLLDQMTVENKEVNVAAYSLKEVVRGKITEWAEKVL